MSTWEGSSPQVSRRSVVVPTNLVEPSVAGAAWTTSPATVRVTTECHVDVAPQSLMGRSILGEPGYVAEERVTASDDGRWHKTEGGDICVACGPASRFWLSRLWNASRRLVSAAGSVHISQAYARTGRTSVVFGIPGLWLVNDREVPRSLQIRYRADMTDHSFIIHSFLYCQQMSRRIRRYIWLKHITIMLLGK